MSDKGTSDATPPFDLSGLNELYGRETVAELLEMSVKEARDLLCQIDTAITERDGRAVMAAAHQLKGLASTMTINDLAQISLELETSARQEQWDTVGGIQERLQAEFRVVADYILSVLNH